MSFFVDSITNVLAQVGMGGDKAAHSRYAANILDDQELLDAYRFSWLPRNVVDVVPDDATRHWRRWNGDPEQVKKIKDIEKEIGLQLKTNQALKDARLFGTSALLIRTNRSTTRAPLRDDEIVEGLEVVSLERNTGGLSRFVSNTQSQQGHREIYEIGKEKIHHSRLSIFRGRYVPRQFMGDSVLFSVYRALMNADSTSASIAALVFEAKVDVFKIPDLMEMVGDPEYEQRLIHRLTIANHGKSVTNSLLMDANEDYEQKTIQFGGLNEVLLTALQIAAGASQIPATKLLGQSVSGLASTGDNEVRDYYDTVAGMQRNEITPTIATIDRMIQLRAGTGADYEWCSLWQETNNEKAENVNKLSAAIKTLSDTMIYSDDTLIDASAQLLGDYMPALEVTNEY